MYFVRYNCVNVWKYGVECSGMRACVYMLGMVAQNEWCSEAYAGIGSTSVCVCINECVRMYMALTVCVLEFPARVCIRD